uniref:hypothetical protein n=1 Tax=Deinococcus wulumuqiensis TaxID=980427 RepID=UPI001E2A2DA1|nr:hypothetical protein [Deinococcus wulumuqiensis]
MRLPAPHALLQKEDAIGRLPGETLEALGEQVLHAVCNHVLVEERLRIDTALGKFIDLQRRVALVVFEHGGAGLKKGAKRKGSGLGHGIS